MVHSLGSADTELRAQPSSVTQGDRSLAICSQVGKSVFTKL
ncbi:MAG: hypothetical protein QOH84_3607 [Kribbellaceae bacterium]|jgi:hypothetical protein|nr:hypothetical protein [Kribbellaceae bacterium]